MFETKTKLVGAVAMVVLAMAGVPASAQQPPGPSPNTPDRTGMQVEGAEPAPPAVTPEPQPMVAGARVRDLDFAGDLGLRGDLNLEGIRATRELSFGIPDRMRLVGDPELTLVITRSGDLLPDVSSITVRVDGRPVATIPLDMEPSQPVSRTVRIPLGATDGYHNVTLVAYHRSRLPCEIDEHPGLWSRIGADSFLRLHWVPQMPELDLARFPRPFADDRDPDPEPVVIVVPPNAGADAVRAAGYVASALAHRISWRALPVRVHVGDAAAAPPGHLVVLRTEAREGLGRLQLSPRAGDDSHAMLEVFGRDEAAIASLAQMLASEPTARLPHGQQTIVTAWRAPRPMVERNWEGWVPENRTFPLSDLGYHDQTVSGYRGGSISFPLRTLPDERVEDGGARVDLQYSYGPRVDGDQARLHVLVDGVAVDGVRLQNPDGETRARMTVNIPASLIRSSSVMEVRFLLPPERGPECTDSFPPNAFGTVHATTRVTLDRTRVARTPDLGNLRFGAFPFGVRPDFAETVFVLPAQPTADELQRFVWVAAELGRVAPAGRFLYTVDLGGRTVRRDDDFGRDLIILDRDESMARTLRLERVLRVHERSRTIDVASGGQIALGPDGETLTAEMTPLPWDEARTALVITGGHPSFFELAGRCGDEDDVIGRFEGRVARVKSCRDVVAVAPVVDPRDEQRERAGGIGTFVREQYWWLLGGLVLLVILILALRGLFGGRRRTSPVPEPAE